MQYLEPSNMREVFQSAYRALHSSETALLRVFNDIIASLGSGNVCWLAFLGLSAAFGTMGHDILLERLKSNFHHKYLLGSIFI